MTEIPDGFSIALVHQEIPSEVVSALDAFIRVFDTVTTRPSWQQRVTASAPEVSRNRRSEVCFFSAWDFHLPPGQPSGRQLIEFNDNGSGLLFAALLNRLFYELSDLAERPDIAPPPSVPVLAEQVADMVEAEARRFLGEIPDGLFLVLDDAESLERGRFRSELVLLRDLLRRRGWEAQISSPAEMQWDGAPPRGGEGSLLHRQSLHGLLLGGRGLRPGLACSVEGHSIE